MIFPLVYNKSSQVIYIPVNKNGHDNYTQYAMFNHKDNTQFSSTNNIKP